MNECEIMEKFRIFTLKKTCPRIVTTTSTYIHPYLISQKLVSLRYGDGLWVKYLLRMYEDLSLDPAPI